MSIKLEGQWTLAADLSYLTDLSHQINLINNAPWGMLIDMREWDLDDVPTFDRSQKTSDIHLDRRNQIAECWLVRNDLQARSLITFIEAVPGLSFQRFLTKSEAMSWLKSFNLSLF